MLPVSFCNIIKRAGKKIINANTTWWLISLTLVWRSLMNLATASEAATLANSLGWTVKDPIPYHEVDPLTVLPKINKPIKDSMDMK